MKYRIQSSRLKAGFFQMMLAAFLVSSAAAEPADSTGGAGSALPVEAAWRIWAEPKFMRPALSQPIPGAKTTVLAAGWADENQELHCFPQKQFELSGKPDWTDFAHKTEAAASAELARLTPEYVRGRNQVIECAVLRSPRQTTVCALLAPDFLKRFSDIFGSKVLIAVPNRFTIYVFPALASRYTDYAGRIASDYHNSSYPVSQEVFELSAQGLKAVGALEGN